MSTIDLVILGILKQEPKSAYDIQKETEYRNIVKWVKISKQSIYSKVIQLEKKGYISAKLMRNGNYHEKAIYTLTEQGEHYFMSLLDEVSLKPVNMFLDFNAVIINLDFFPKEICKKYLENIKENILLLKTEILQNIDEKAHIPIMGKSILNQQLALVEVMEKWIIELLEPFN